MDFAKLGINVFEAGYNGTLQVVFDDYSIRPQFFKYGPQPPDFNGTAFDLKPYMDKEDDDLGVALFFSVLFDKVSICKYLHPHHLLVIDVSQYRLMLSYHPHTTSRTNDLSLLHTSKKGVAGKTLTG